METAPGGRFSFNLFGALVALSVIDHADFSVVVKNGAPPPKSWRWEIYRVGRTSPIERSEAFFETMGEANRAGVL